MKLELALWIVGGFVVIAIVCTIVSEVISDLYGKLSWALFGPPYIFDDLTMAIYRELSASKRDLEANRIPEDQLRNHPEAKRRLIEEYTQAAVRAIPKYFDAM